MDSAVLLTNHKVYGYVVYQQRITMIKQRYPGETFYVLRKLRSQTFEFGNCYRSLRYVNSSMFSAYDADFHVDQILGPVVICIFLFTAVLTNFILRG